MRELSPKPRARGRHRARVSSAALSPLLLGLLLSLLAQSCRPAATPVAGTPAAPSSAPAAKAPEIVRTKSGVEMVSIPAGWFHMGTAVGRDDETPAHRVWIDAFLMDRFEVTQEEFARLAVRSPLLSADPSHFKGPKRPVEMVGWGIAALYANERSRAEGLEACYDEEGGCDFDASGYRLPTEAEWEYACRAGTNTAYSFGDDTGALRAHAWHADNSGKQTHPVGGKRPNPWGLFDMHGNVAEWCNDPYDKDYYATSPERNPRGPAEGKEYVLRGGAWNSGAEACRSAYRVGEAPGMQDACFARDAIGFRCVRKAPKTSAGPGGIDGARGEERRSGAGEPAVAERPTAAERPDVAVHSAAAGESGVELKPSAAEPSSMAEHPGAGEQPGAAAAPSAVGESGPAGQSGAAGESRSGGPSSDAETAGAAGGAKSLAASRTGFLYGEIYLRHKTGTGHPERPERLTAIVERLKAAGLLSRLSLLEPAPASREWLTSVHTPEYAERVEKDCRSGQGYVDTGDAPASKESYDVAVAAVGGVLSTVDRVVEGKIRNAFCAVRPPGHHALKDRAMGFCLFNNVSIAARYIQKKHKLSKVLIVDWDVHHGNGTQAAFYDDPTVLYFSVHLSPFYPGSGSAEEKGEGKGLGFTLNVPLPAGSGDADYRKAFEEKLVPAADAFRPDFVLVSAGFDASADDLLGRMQVSPQGFADLTRIVRRIAERHCRGRLVSLLEGGYNLERLAASVEAHLRVLLE